MAEEMKSKAVQSDRFASRERWLMAAGAQQKWLACGRRTPASIIVMDLPPLGRRNLVACII